MDFSVVIAIIISCCVSILLISLMVFSMRDNSYKLQEETKEIKKEIKLVIHDAEYNKLAEQYGRNVVLMAEISYNQLLLALNDKESISLSFADMCELQNENLREQAKKLKEQEAEIKRVKSLSKEELE